MIFFTHAYTRDHTQTHTPHAGLRCTECGYNVHEKCVPQVPKNCAKFGGAGSVISSGGVTSGGADRNSTASNVSSAAKGAAPTGANEDTPG